jgi:RNA polymerase sigma-70 factor (ECF subfamily)
MAERDETALSEFYDRYHRFVYSLALRIVGSSADAEDVVVDVFWQAWQQARQFDPARGKAMSWLMTMTRTRAIDRRRGLQRQGALTQALEGEPRDTSEPVANLEDDRFAAERRRRVRAALDSLPEAQRRAIEMAYYEGLSQSEIAAALNEPPGTIKTWIRRGLIHLRQGLAS